MSALLPWRLHLGGPQPEVEWMAGDGQPFAEPFFDQTLQRLRLLPQNRPGNRPRTPVDALVAHAAAAAPTAFIFHVSRCGSTLLCQMLAALARNTVISEARLIDEILRAARQRSEVTDEQRIAWLRGAIGALAPRASGRQMFVKLDCWHVFDVPLLHAAFPEVPKLFLFRDPVEVVVSLLRRPSLTLLPGTLPPRAPREALLYGEDAALPWEERTAAVIGALLKAAWEHRERLTPVAYAELPRFAWEAMPGTRPDAAEQAQMQRAAEFNSKFPSEPFRPDSAEKQREASAAVRAAVARFATPWHTAWQARRGVAEPAPIKS